MRREEEWLRLTGMPGPGRGPGLLTRLLSFLATAGLLALALTVSVVIFAVLAVAGMLVGVWFWWKTRALRRELKRAEEEWRATPHGRTDAAGGTSSAAEGVVIEGEVIRVEEPAAELPRKPGAP